MHIVVKVALGIVLSALLIVGWQSVSGTSSALAAINDPCLNADLIVNTPLKQSVKGVGESENNCKTSVHIFQTLSAYSSCPGLGNGSGRAQKDELIDVHSWITQSFTINAGCVVCHYVNNLLTGQTYPDFTILINVQSSGTFLANKTIFYATSNVATYSVKVINLHLYAPPCPATE